ncbi:hypothetical protein [Clostridium saccharobutylicum]|uniref:Uncharacterized protein n=1 Tax=Clostridium saccharobutylicum TaxID=169679 RepID=A0A1S8MT79_CLOSA|nr:hypothetical protein [Clostridium saccharobutylicum]OOM07378.1 hypothetical protein CLOSAC_39070 [Clostridium saccharobutylicum]
MLNNQSIKDAGYDLESVGREAPTSPDDKIIKGIDGLYKNKNVRHMKENNKSKML